MAEVRMSLVDAAKALNLAPNGVRSRFKSGKIKGERDNNGRIWVWIDMNAANEVTSKRLRQKVTTEGGTEPILSVLEGHINDLRAENAGLKAEVGFWREKGLEADRLDGTIIGLRAQIDDLKQQRGIWQAQSDNWMNQAQKVALPGPAKGGFWSRLFK